jgi:ABC-type phosphate transport system substrate-binding protein
MRRTTIGAVVATLFLSGCGERPNRILNGTGSTFVAPIMNKWVEEYRIAKGAQVNYEAIGSSAGVKRLASGVFDFACTEAPFSPMQLAAVENAGEIAYIPLVLGAVVPAYNLSSIKAQVSFSGPILADIFLGKSLAGMTRRCKSSTLATRFLMSPSPSSTDRTEAAQPTSGPSI